MLWFSVKEAKDIIRICQFSFDPTDGGKVGRGVKYKAPEASKSESFLHVASKRSPLHLLHPALSP